MEQLVPKRLPENAEGDYYTTECCDGCAYCAAVAPDNFDFNREQNTYFVSRQPLTPDEKEYVQEAMDDCPVEAIQRKKETPERDPDSRDQERGDAA